MFSIRKDKYGYYIGIALGYEKYAKGVADKNIAAGINMTVYKYHKILAKYNGKPVYLSSSYQKEYYFEKEEDCERCIEYLNNNYGILVVLGDSK